MNICNFILIVKMSDEKHEDFITNRVDRISILFHECKNKSDLDFILKKFNIKCKKNDKVVTTMYLKMHIKYKIIKMAIDEPDDIFDYDHYSHINQIESSDK